MQVAVTTPPTIHPPQRVFKQIFSRQFVTGRGWYGLILAITINGWRPVEATGQKRFISSRDSFRHNRRRNGPAAAA